MGRTLTYDLNHIWVKFQHRHKPVKPDKLFTSKIQSCNKQRVDIPIPKEKKIGKKEGVMDPSKSKIQQSKHHWTFKA